MLESSADFTISVIIAILSSKSFNLPSKTSCLPLGLFSSFDSFVYLGFSVFLGRSAYLVAGLGIVAAVVTFLTGSTATGFLGDGSFFPGMICPAPEKVFGTTFF